MSAFPLQCRSSSSYQFRIVLYAITGCVSALFIVVIISGAIRAIRHPERYGPRRGGHGGAPSQSRAKGLGRAILETFPLVKFGAPDANTHFHKESNDDEQSVKDIEMVHLPRQNMESPSPQTGEASDYLSHHTDDKLSQRSTQFASNPTPTLMTEHKVESVSKDMPASSQPGTRPATAGRNEADDVVPASIGRDTCPICIVDFEEGDDIRVLPCDGKHCFHQECVDPWLLKLSSSCPICRHGELDLCYTLYTSFLTSVKKRFPSP